MPIQIIEDAGWRIGQLYFRNLFYLWPAFKEVDNGRAALEPRKGLRREEAESKAGGAGEAGKQSAGPATRKQQTKSQAFKIMALNKRSLVLPIAILIGFIINRYCGTLSVIVPYLIFTILLLNFSSVKIKELRLAHLGGLNIWLLLFQIFASIGGYALVMALGADEMVAEGILVGVLCPVAAASVVIACMLGAGRATITAYTIICNIMVAIVAPIYFSFIGIHQEMPFLESFALILKKIAPVIALPFFVALLFQSCIPKANDAIARISGASFYIWALTLTITLGQTINMIIRNGKENMKSIVVMGIISILLCALQFGFGKWIGKKYGDTIAGGQALGQKNSAFGIWMANVYLHPLASVFPALYSIWQNLFNSWQLYRVAQKSKNRLP